MWLADQIEHRHYRKPDGQPLDPSDAEALHFIMPLSVDYPGIDRWFCEKVAPGMKDGSRHIFKLERDGKIVGLGIAKHTEDERKICTVRIAPGYVGKGFGLRIFDNLLKWLDTDQPHLTVSEQKAPAFSRIFDWYGFRRTSEKQGLYLPKRVELIYNEGDLGRTTEVVSIRKNDIAI